MQLFVVFFCHFLHIIFVDIDNSKIYPPFVNATIGQKVTFICQTSRYSVWFFSKDLSTPIEDLNESSNTFTIEMAMIHHTGYYFCHNPYIQNKHLTSTYQMSKKYFVAIAYLHVKGMFTRNIIFIIYFKK